MNCLTEKTWQLMASRGFSCPRKHLAVSDSWSSSFQTRYTATETLPSVVSTGPPAASTEGAAPAARSSAPRQGISAQSLCSAGCSLPPPGALLADASSPSAAPARSLSSRTLRHRQHRPRIYWGAPGSMSRKQTAKPPAKQRDKCSKEGRDEFHHIQTAAARAGVSTQVHPVLPTLLHQPPAFSFCHEESPQQAAYFNARKVFARGWSLGSAQALHLSIARSLAHRCHRSVPIWADQRLTCKPSCVIHAALSARKAPRSCCEYRRGNSFFLGRFGNQVL